MKTALQGDRTLPSNAVVAKLKALVTEFKATLPVVVNLRCPALRRRHWAAIHQAVGYEIKVRSTCLGLSCWCWVRKCWNVVFTPRVLSVRWCWTRHFGVHCVHSACLPSVVPARSRCVLHS
jgi:hypothetical protein